MEATLQSANGASSDPDDAKLHVKIISAPLGTGKIKPMMKIDPYVQRSSRLLQRSRAEDKLI